jgi:dihydroflavonol-4-reductase
VSGDRVFLTGGSGFVGGAVLRRLLEAGRDVVALARTETTARDLERLGARPWTGDVLDRSSLESGMRGCRAVFHAAGLNEMCSRQPRSLFRTNVEGTGNVMVAAARAQVARVVYTSSAATVGEARGSIGREDSPHRGWFLSSYERSKYLAERRVLEWGSELEVDVVCLNPSSVQGPGRVDGSARLLLDLVNGRLPALVDTYVSIVDVRDCADAHLLAERAGGTRQRYVLNGATLPVHEAVEMLASVTRLPRRPRWLAPWVATVAASVVELGARALRRRPPVCREMVRTLVHGHRYDGSLAPRELGLRYTPIEETIRRTLEWYAERGLAPPPVGSLGAGGRS